MDHGREKNGTIVLLRPITRVAVIKEKQMRFIAIIGGSGIVSNPHVIIGFFCIECICDKSNHLRGYNL